MRCAWVLGGKLVVLGLGNIMYVGCEPFWNEDRAIFFLQVRLLVLCVDAKKKFFKRKRGEWKQIKYQTSTDMYCTHKPMGNPIITTHDFFFFGLF